MLNDQEIMMLLASHGLNLGQLFIADGRIYSSEDAGCFSASSTYTECDNLSNGEIEVLLNFLRRLAKPEYGSIENVDSEIARARDWEAIFSQLSKTLDKHGKQDQFGSGDFFLADDDYGYQLLEVGCVSSQVVTSDLITDVQGLLKLFSGDWQIVFTYPSEGGGECDIVVYSDRVDREAG